MLSFPLNFEIININTMDFLSYNFNYSKECIATVLSKSFVVGYAYYTIVKHFL